MPSTSALLMVMSFDLKNSAASLRARAISYVPPTGRICRIGTASTMPILHSRRRATSAQRTSTPQDHLNAGNGIKSGNVSRWNNDTGPLSTKPVLLTCEAQWRSVIVNDLYEKNLCAGCDNLS